MRHIDACTCAECVPIVRASGHQDRDQFDSPLDQLAKRYLPGTEFEVSSALVSELVGILTRVGGFMSGEDQEILRRAKEFLCK